MVQKNVNFSREELILSRNGQYQTDAVNVWTNQSRINLLFFVFRVQLTLAFCMLRNRGIIFRESHWIRRNDKGTEDVGWADFIEKDMWEV
jgi:hypothetical protein